MDGGNSSEAKETALPASVGGRVRPLKAWLGLIFAAILLPAMVIMGIAVWQAGRSLEQNALQLLRENAGIVAGVVEGQLANAALATASQRLNGADFGFILDEQGRPRGGIGPIEIPQALVRETRASRQPVFSNLIDLPEFPMPQILVLAPDSADPRLIVGRLLSPDRIVTALQRDPRQLDSTLLVIIDGTGRVIARSRDAELTIGKTVPAWRQLRDLPPGQASFQALSHDSVPTRFAFRAIEGTPGWVAAVGEPVDQYNARWRSPLVGLTVAMLLVILSALLASVWVARRIIRPVQALAQHASGVAALEHPVAMSPLTDTLVAEFHQLRCSFEAAENALRQQATREREAAEMIARSERRYRALAELGTLVFWRRDAVGDVIWSLGWSDFTGDSEESASGDGWLRRVHPDDRHILSGAWEESLVLARPLDTEFRVLTDSDKWRWVRARGTPVHEADGSIAEWVGVLEDTNDRRQAQQRIAHLAHHDYLTNLPNRALFGQHLAATLNSARRGKARNALLSIDLDRFKEVNDTLGHPVGDQLLCAVARRLMAEVRSTDLVARLGGDEFAVIQMAEEQPQDVTALAERLVKAISAPYHLSGHRVVIGASIGATIIGPEADPEQLMRECDAALYRAKRSGKGRSFLYDETLDERLRRRRTVEADLQLALARDELELGYQPIVRLSDGQCVGYEAIIHWIHPERGRQAAAMFSRVAEESGLMPEIGRRMLAEACRTAAGWDADHRLAFTLYPSQLASPSLAFQVAEIVEESGLAPSRLELQIAEDAFVTNPKAAFRTLRRLNRLGIAISMVGLGSGRSFLRYLRDFPYDRVKIDGAFLRSIPDEAEKAALVHALITLCATLGITATAENVESEDDLRLLSSEQCAEAQGPALGRALAGPEDNAARLLPMNSELA